MKCIEIVRRYGPHGITRVFITTAEGNERYFDVGRHVDSRRIYALAQSNDKYKGEIKR